MTQVTLRATSFVTETVPGTTSGGSISANGAGASVITNLADDSDATHVKYDVYAISSNGPNGTTKYSPALRLSHAALPAGAVVTGTQVRGRLRAAGAPGSFATFVMQAQVPSGTARQSFNSGSLDTQVAQSNYNGTAFSNMDSTVYAASSVVPQVYAYCYHDSAGTAFIEHYESYLDIRYFTEAGTPTGLTAANITTTPRPTFSWSHVAGASAGTQNAFRVKVFTLAQASIGGFSVDTSPHTLDSGIVQSGTSSYLAGFDIPNGVTYRAYVQTFNGGSGVNTPASAWSALHQFTTAIPVPVPTALTPVVSAVSTTSRPAVGASVAAMTGGVQIKREWTLATDASFTLNVRTIIDDTLGSTKSGTVAFPVLPARLAQGTWYIRARTLDSFGVASAWTGTNTFSVLHAATSSNRQPSSGIALAYEATKQVTWVFNDPDPEDYQLKYEVELWKLSAPGTVIASGVITSATAAHTFTIPDITWKATDLRWRLRTTDRDNIAGAWSVDQSFFLYDIPVPAITFPAEAQVISSAQPNFTWTFTAANSRTQASWRMVVTQVGVGVVADSGVVAGTALAWLLPSPVILVGVNYSATLTTVDSVGLPGSDTNAFTATYLAPTTPVFTLNTASFATAGLIVVDWSTSNTDGTNLRWKVLRRLTGTLTWTLIGETATGVKTYSDYLAPSATNIEYSVVQVAESFGSSVESAYPIQSFYGESEYALVCPVKPALNLRLYIVTSDDFEDEQEMATQNLIGRGRRVEYGTRFGQTGSLTADFRDQSGGPTARQQTLALQALRTSGLLVYLRNPFGDVWAVAAQSAGISRVPGVGMQAMATASIAYTEITA